VVRRVADEAGQHLDHSIRTNAAGHVYRQTFASELVDDGEAFQVCPLAQPSNAKS
jgi:hypothetical protein